MKVVSSKDEKQPKHQKARKLTNQTTEVVVNLVTKQIFNLHGPYMKKSGTALQQAIKMK